MNNDVLILSRAELANIVSTTLREGLKGIYAKLDHLEAAINDHGNDLKGYSTEKVCEMLNISSATLWRWAKMGKLTPIKCGKKRLYLKADIDNYLNGIAHEQA